MESHYIINSYCSMRWIWHCSHLWTCSTEEKRQHQLCAVADEEAAAAGADGDPAHGAQHPHSGGGWGWHGAQRVRVLRAEGGARGEGQRLAAPLLCSHGHCWPQVRNLLMLWGFVHACPFQQSLRALGTSVLMPLCSQNLWQDSPISVLCCCKITSAGLLGEL